MSEIPKTSSIDLHTAIEYAANEDSGSFERESLLSEFARKPDGDSIWDKAYSMAQQEESEGENPYSEFDDIPVSELIELSKKVRATADFRERYQLMAEEAPNGKIWFDVLTGFSSPDVEVGIETYLTSRLENIPNRKFEVGVDLGCATGRVAEVLTKFCDRTVGLDASEALIEVAKQRSGDEVEYRVGDVTALQSADNSVDIITATGLIGALNAHQEVRLFEEASRVLKDGGMLIDGYWENNLQAALIKLSWKNTLADMIVDTVSGKYQAGHLNGHQRDDLRRHTGLARTKHKYSWIPQTSVVVYEKDKKKLAAQIRGYSRGLDTG